MTSAQIRQAFLDFFAAKGHQIVPSAPVVVKNDPTLMFINSGMAPFKDYFLGNKTAPNPRVADTQKCLRVSGKHNDLEEVGVDTYHHTLFEMLGNWSFGNYFKKEAIEWSWELLTKVLGIPEDRMYVTVFEGDAAEGLPVDEEAAAEWKKWIAPDRILLGKKKDNFWEMGDTGPCGPCTEIHVDTRPDSERTAIDGKTLVNNDHPQVIEIWNNVFIQFNRTKDGSLQPLPAAHVDTGMGFERLVRVLQGKQSNYDTDVFTGTIAAIERITGKTYEGSDAGKPDIAFRVLADHIRAVSFTIADGQLPSNTGAGYVIRRILRRAVRYYYSYLDYKQPLLHQLVPVLAGQFATVFPELLQQESFVARVIREEEEAFLRTLDKGLKRIDDLLAKGSISGAEAFELNDTYGFPFDLTQLIASERGLTVNEADFKAEMQKQKDRSRAATATDAGDWVTVSESNQNSLFVGYDSLETKATILRYRQVTAKGKESFQVVLDRTPFYAESGGQVGDTGLLVMGDQRIRILDTKKENDLIIHFAESLPEAIGGEWTAKVDGTRRGKTQVHHSATHLLHAALRQVLGTHVAQKGSLVNAEYLRFDFSHFARMTAEEIARVEHIVNEKIRENIPVVIRQMPKEEALQLGAMALFGEKYGDTVRVVTMDPNYSVELCGGTHVGSTGELGFFKISSESAVAAGVRRLEALCGAAAEMYLNEQLQQLQAVKEALKSPKDLVKAITSLQDENSSLQKQLEKYQLAQLNGLREGLLAKQEAVNGAAFIGAQVSVGNADALKKLAFDIKGSLPNAAVALVANIDGKASVAIAFDDALVAGKGLDAGALIKQVVAPLIKGGGGGQKGLATAGGQETGSLQAVIDAVRAKL
ncbi:alanine--tRNA ligase [Flaviaesturariibacter amylovorans]|uniref:Alanine--tRNA ligase n=2 Tax=Flaviaesturariibacter amylovorans TaxID=1084520 RepID=A0ABP8GB32_9BACT